MSRPSLKPGYIGPLSLRNRIVFPPMVSNFCNADGSVTPRFIGWHTARGRGGCGLVMTEATMITNEGRSFPNQLGIHNDQLLAGLKKLTDAVHATGAKIAVQLYHPGRQTSASICGAIPLSPSGTAFNGEQTRVLATEDITKIADAFGAAAARAKAAGFDAVEVHGGNGYLLQQFHSRLTNRREDEYGGSLGKRTRFSREVLQSIRLAVGDDFPIILRLGMDEQTPGGLEPLEGLRIAQLLAPYVDAIDIVAGMRERGWLVTAPAALPEGVHLNLARMARKELDIPLIISGRILNLQAADRVIDEGIADFIGMGRSQIADPNLVIKSERALNGLITVCLSCNEACMGRLATGKDIACAVNPKAGHEWKYDENATDGMDGKRWKRDKPKVLVVGAGPAGCHAAIAAAERGADVILLERGASIGGKLLLAALPPFKSQITKWLASLTAQLEFHGIRPYLRKEATPDLVASLSPDKIILACGAEPFIPEIPGLLEHGYILADEALTAAPDTLPEAVLILGGGLVGAELAEKLAIAGKDVTIVEMRSEVGADVEPRSRHLLLKRLKQLGVRLLTGQRVLRVKGNALEADGDSRAEKIDIPGALVLACGYRPARALAQTLKQAGFNVAEVGDGAPNPMRERGIFGAVCSGHKAGHNAF